MVTTTELLKTPLHDWHASNGGRMVDFAGWSMPVQYSSIIQEHEATRTKFGLFDVSHMGRFLFKDPSAIDFLEGLTTRRVHGMEAGKIRYSLMMNRTGGILDDVLVYHLERLDGTPFVYMVVNASNRTKILNWLNENGDLDQFGFVDRTVETAMIAVQGPGALDAAAKLVQPVPSELKYYHGRTVELLGEESIVSRTGYTGEDGCELIVPANKAVEVWKSLMESGGTAAGLGARDTLRLEAAMPLYGHELTETTNPVQADIGFAINLKDREFVGRSEIVAAKKDESLQKRVGIELQGKRAAREHSDIYAAGQRVGEVTSGTFSPTLQRPIAMGFVDPQFTADGTEIEIDIRGTRTPARVVPLPFYKRS